MSDARLDPKHEEILAQWRRSIGREAFDAASPGMTLRARTSQIAATVPSPDATVAQPIAPKSAAPSTLAPKKDSLARWSEYAIQELVGEGGMGQIFKADQGSLRRDVAIKKIIPEHLEKESATTTKESFVSEALVTGFLEHPNIVPVHSLGQDEKGEWFFSMKMVRGIAWKYLLHPDQCNDDAACEKAKAMNLDIDDPAQRLAHREENLKILQTVCNAVAFAHSKNIIHRDLKPENVMVGAFGEVLVMDWGLAVDVSETQSDAESRVPHKTMAGVGGTAEYMSPEQLYADGNRLSARTDVFLLGAILYELLTGKAPNTAGNLDGAMIKAVQCDEPREFENVPVELAEICRKALSKEPQQRQPDALAIQRALNDFLKHQAAATIAAKAEKEARVQEIPNLARAVVLYDQALELWPENHATQDAVMKTRGTLAKKEGRNRLVWRGLGAAVVAIVVGLTVGFLWIKSAKDAETAAKEETKKQLVESQHQEGIAWLERANLRKQANDQFAAALFATRAIGFKNYGRRNDDMVLSKSFAELLRPETEMLSEAKDFADLASGKPIWQSISFPMGISCVSFSPDGTILALGVDDNSIRLLDVATGKERLKLVDSNPAITGTYSTIRSISFSPNGAMIASVSSGSYCHIFDVVTGAQTFNIADGSDDMDRAVFSPDGVTLATWNTGTSKIKLWDVLTKKEKGILIGVALVLDVCFSPDGETLASGNSDKTVRLWGVADSSDKGELRGHSEKVTCVSFSPDGKVLASGSFDNTIRLWELDSGKLRGEIKGHTNVINNVSFSADGTVLASASADKTVRLWDVNACEERLKIESFSFFPKASFSPDGATLASICENNTIRLWDVSIGKEMGKLKGHTSYITSVQLSPDGRTLASGSTDRTVRLWDVKTLRQKAQLDGHSDTVRCVRFSPDGGNLASGSSDHNTMLWNIVTNQIGVLDFHNDEVTSVCFSPDGKTLVSGSLDKTIWIWNIPNGLHTGIQGAGAVLSLAFSPDGRKLASCGDSLRVFDVVKQEGTTGLTSEWDDLRNAIILEQPEYALGTTGVCFSPDGSILASAHSNKTIQLWDVATRAQKKKLVGLTSPAQRLSFSPNGVMLASESDDNSILLWEGASGKLIARLAKDSLQIPVWVGADLRASNQMETMIVDNSRNQFVINVFDTTIQIDYAAYVPYFEITRDGLKPIDHPEGMPYLNVNPYSHIGILRSGKPPDEINRLLFWRYYRAMNKNSAGLMLKRLPPGKDRDEAQDAFDRRFVTKDDKK